MPKVSVLLTSYNHGQFIRESIESILNQTYKDFELFVVDDCSSDNSWDIIQEYAKKDERIVPIRHPYNQGSSGIDKKVYDMKGDYVAIAHCDDAWKVEKLEKQVQVLDENPNITACFTLVDVIDDEGKLLSDDRHVHHHVFEQDNKTRYEWLRHFFYNGNCLCHPSLLIRKTAYTEMKITTKGLSGLPDFCQWIRVCKKADIYILQERLTKFRTHNDGSNTSGDNAGSIHRHHVEEWFVLKEFEELVDTQEVTDVFPEAKQYIVDGEICEKYALAKVMLGSPKSSYNLYGLQLLYELFQDEEQEQKILRLYDYTRKKYSLDKQKYDVFHVIPANRYLQVSIYLNCENGYSEENKVQKRVFVQQTGTFRVEVDLNGYTEEMVKKLRVDLDEGKYRKFKLYNCSCAGESIEYKATNGITQGDWDVFYTMDPQYEFRLEKTGCLCIEGKVEEVLCDEVEQYFSERQQKYDAMSEKVERIENTKIWRIRKKILRLLRR